MPPSMKNSREKAGREPVERLFYEMPQISATFA